ncbi:hypothetical protein BBO99_00005933 [Phytophthora kernoviae]|uniref:Spore coat protein CotH n=2 Tax=Phytophthora kernoviae TaxID=325452 RepID=A0A421EUW9_9STRA|nr:hypothetical protein G195_005878 [Phytophthora kernoviae 00238/432]KAG2522653.1 hypothetical protein JM16_005754 [Phytophthora kernoviae]KAG2524338.1 hypothetical protein JM18_005438 [Phytophthora kernoviae]RLN02651.1 hypothetical protein BBI17_005995 [Phytophthora kernoviae]RLN78475.1 hypothetical protein BBO99_00005933 [Phytophthora kernoviae]
MRILSILALLASLQNALAQQQSAQSLECYEMPIVIVSAMDRSFPDPTCNQLRYPAADCLKDVVETRVEVIDNAVGELNCVNGPRTAVYEQTSSNYRGQTSLFFSKHQFNIKFSEETSFLGMPENSKFVMNGPFLDCTLLRNHLAHWLYRSTGRYSVQTRHAVVYMRTDPAQKEPRYAGIYLLLEKMSYGKKHVDLASMNTECAARDPSVLNGGWAWSNDPPSYGSYSPNMVVDQYQNEFGMGERPMLAHPSGSSLSQQMRDYFVNTDTGFLPQMYRTLWNNMTTPKEIEKHLDLGSFADYLLHTEMSLNVDAYRRSTFYFKDRDQPINAGPVWDLNLAYGNGARRHFKDWIYPQYTYWKRLMCNSQLASYVIQRWKTLRGSNMQKADDPVFGVWSDDSIAKFLDASAAPMHRQLSKCRGGDWRTDVVQCAVVDLKTCNGTYAERVTELQDAVLARARWMDERIETLYKKLDAETCSGVGEIPKYNCGLDGNDDGCLSNAEKYYNAVQFPSVRKPYTGATCKDIITSKDNVINGEERGSVALSTYEQPSIDHCWLSAGSYVYPEQKGVKDRSLTPFCSGYGSCSEGPGAACNCSVGVAVEHPSCRRIDAENEHYTRQQATAAKVAKTTISKMTTATTASKDTAVTYSSETDVIRSRHSPLMNVVAIVAAAAGCVALMLGAWWVKEHARRRRSQHLSEYTPVHYGSVEHARIFAHSSQTDL